MTRTKRMCLALAVCVAVGGAGTAAVFAVGLLGATPSCAQGGCPKGMVVCCKKTMAGNTECHCEYPGFC
jgi:hypothetical protein